jgi:hypothetical protein
MSPANPAMSPVMTFRDNLDFSTIAPISATHKGMVEVSNAVIPDVRYCAPHTSSHCPPRTIKTPSINPVSTAFCQYVHFLYSPIYE